jgi:hypothetical protein
MREKDERETVGKGGSPRANTKKKSGFFHHLDQVTTSFFFTNFPEDATTGDLWKIFQGFGRVGEVYIPKKLDKRGRRFGFVKFKDVLDVEELGDRLKEVWCGTFKLWVNLSRFVRTERVDAIQKPSPSRQELRVEEAKSGRSFRSALLGGARSKELKVISVRVNEELCKEIQGGVVGKLAREKDVRRIQTILFMEGYKSISVTHMGGNMALLRSPVEGDVPRLLRSKNECLQYFFSDLKPWNPGMLPTHREVWVQVYGIPLHIWGETFFKQLGNNLGDFLDFDEETARMARFDVARVKIRSTSWAFIDAVQKVEVEGAMFDIWVVEETGRKGSMVMVNEGLEDEVSQAVPLENDNSGDEASGEGEEFSGEDEVSGDEHEVDGTKLELYGDGHEVGCGRVLGDQLPKQRNFPLTCDKSNNITNFNEVIPPVLVDNVVLEEKVSDICDKDGVGSVSSKDDDNRALTEGGTRTLEETICLNKGVGEVAGLSNPVIDPMLPDLIGPAQQFSDPPFLGQLVEEGVNRVSSISEPEEMFTPQRNKLSKIRRNKSCSKFNQLGVPKCIKLVEMVKESKASEKKLRSQRRGGSAIGSDEGRTGAETWTHHHLTDMAEEGTDGREGCSNRQDERWKGSIPGATPVSGLQFLSGSEASRVSDSQKQTPDEDKVKLIEAAKLLKIQKEVGFNFVEATCETLKVLVEQENNDRTKKMVWEGNVGDQ